MTAPTVDQLSAILEQQEDRPGDGVAVYVFEAGERVPRNHPAVRACPEAFMELEEWEAEASGAMGGDGGNPVP